MMECTIQSPVQGEILHQHIYLSHARTVDVSILNRSFEFTLRSIRGLA